MNNYILAECLPLIPQRNWVSWWLQTLALFSPGSGRMAAGFLRMFMGRQSPNKEEIVKANLGMDWGEGCSETPGTSNSSPLTPHSGVFLVSHLQLQQKLWGVCTNLGEELRSHQYLGSALIDTTEFKVTFLWSPFEIELRGFPLKELHAGIEIEFGWLWVSQSTMCRLWPIKENKPQDFSTLITHRKPTVENNAQWDITMIFSEQHWLSMFCVPWLKHGAIWHSYS